MSPFEQLQTDIEGFLLSHEELQYVQIVHVRPRTAEEATGIQTKLDNSLAGKLPRNGKKGMSCIINMPGLEKVEANVRSVSGGLLISILFVEDIMINMGAEGTQVSAEEHALEAARLLNHMNFFEGTPLVSQPRLITPVPEAVRDKKVMYLVNLEVSHHSANKAKVSMPKVAQDGNEITLTCSTAEALIYYALDGTFPGPGNEAAQLYTAPFELPVGTHGLRVAAFLSGSAGSNVTNVKVTVE